MKGPSPVELRRKAWEVLSFLAERPGVIVSGNDLLENVWPETSVTPQTVTNVIHELRVALDDGAGPSRWIQTVHRRGHVFLPWGGNDPIQPLSQTVVGRESELARLSELCARALGGERRLAFVIGDPGIGKTTLVDEFRGKLESDASGAWHARGCSIEQRGHSEAYQPFLSAIDQLATGSRQREVSAALRLHAPTWLFQIPRLLRADERRSLEPALVATTSSRMLREGLALVAALARSRPLLLVLEDLHWADQETLDFVGAIARDPEPLRLLVVATCRPADPAMREYDVIAMSRALAREGRASEIAVSPFDSVAVAAYLEARLGCEAALESLCERLADQSAGNPLFLRALVDELLERGVLERAESGWRLAADAASQLRELPESLRKAVQSTVSALPDELRAIVELASVAGSEVTVPELEVASDLDPQRIEEICESLAGTGRLLQHSGEVTWVDGKSVRRYAFPHPSHQRIVYDLLPPIRRRALHRRLAVGLEAAYGEHSSSIARCLAVHFEHGGVPEKALVYLERASTNAESAHAYREAADYVSAAIEKCDAGNALPRDRAAAVGELHLRRGSFLVLANGYSTPEVESAFVRARDLFSMASVSAGRFVAEMGLTVFYLTRARYELAREGSDRLIELSTTQVPPLAAIAQCWSGFVSSATGDLVRARGELVAGLSLPAIRDLPRNFNVHRMIESQLAIVLAVCGDVDESRLYVKAALTLSEAEGAVPDVAHARMLAAEHAVFLSDYETGPAIAADAVAFARDNDFKSYLALCRAYEAVLRRDWSAEERIGTIRSALADRRLLGDRWHESMLRALLAEIALAAGDADVAAAELALASAHVAETGERHYEAEILRLKAECSMALATASHSPSTVTIELLERSIALARAQGAERWRLRALESLGRLRDGPMQ